MTIHQIMLLVMFVTVPVQFVVLLAFSNIVWRWFVTDHAMEQRRLRKTFYLIDIGDFGSALFLWASLVCTGYAWYYTLLGVL